MKFCDEVGQVWRRSFQSFDAKFFVKNLLITTNRPEKGFLVYEVGEGETSSFVAHWRLICGSFM